MTSISVIIPTYNGAPFILDALRSLEASLAYMQGRFAAHPELSGFQAEAIIVDDHSTDDTVAVVQDYIAHKPLFRFTITDRNRGVGTARNLGVKTSHGELIFYLDQDDTYLEKHLYYCVQALASNPLFGAVKTQARLSAPVHPYWKQVIESTIPITTCIRRDVHDFIGGFVEDPRLKELKCEDSIYFQLLRNLFRIIRIQEETVVHNKTPGNAFDRQYERFSNPPEQNINALNEREAELRPEIIALFKERLAERILLRERLLAHKSFADKPDCHFVIQPSKLEQQN